MQGSLIVTRPVRIEVGRRGRKHLKIGHAKKVDALPGNVPRIARLLALARKIDGQIRAGVVKDQVEAAELGHVTRARLTQIMNLTLLAPDIQEEILFWPLVEKGRDPLTEGDLRTVSGLILWDEQREEWARLKARLN